MHLRQSDSDGRSLMRFSFFRSATLLLLELLSVRWRRRITAHFFVAFMGALARGRLMSAVEKAGLHSRAAERIPKLIVQPSH